MTRFLFFEETRGELLILILGFVRIREKRAIRESPLRVVDVVGLNGLEGD